MRLVRYAATTVLVGLCALGVRWFWADADSAPVARGTELGAEPPPFASADQQVRALATDRFRAENEDAAQRQIVQIQFMTGEEPRTSVDADANGWVSFDGRTLVTVDRGVSDPVPLRCGRQDMRVLLRGRRHCDGASFEVEFGRAVYTCPSPLSGVTLSGVATRDGQPVAAGEKLSLDIAGICVLSPDWWDTHHTEIETYDGGFWFWPGGLGYLHARVGVALADGERSRMWGPRPLPVSRGHWPEGEHWDIGPIACEDPPILIRTRIAWPNGQAPTETEHAGQSQSKLKMTFRPFGMTGDAVPTYVCERPGVPGAELDVIGATPWPRFEAEARFGKFRWRSEAPLTAGAEVEMRFGVTGKIVGHIEWENPAERTAQVTARSASGAVHTIAVPQRGMLDYHAFSMAGLAPGSYTVTVECWGERRAVKRNVLISDDSDAKAVNTGIFKIPSVPMRTRQVTVLDENGDPLRSPWVWVSVGERDLGFWRGDDGVVTYKEPFGSVVRVRVGGDRSMFQTFTSLTVPKTVRLTNSNSVSVMVDWRPMPHELVREHPVEVEIDVRPVAGTPGAIVRRSLSTSGLPFAPIDGLHFGNWSRDTTVELSLIATVRPHLLPPREYREPFRTVRLDQRVWAEIPDVAFDKLAATIR